MTNGLLLEVVTNFQCHECQRAKLTSTVTTTLPPSHRLRATAGGPPSTQRHSVAVHHLQVDEIDRLGALKDRIDLPHEDRLCTAEKDCTPCDITTEKDRTHCGTSKRPLKLAAFPGNLRRPG